MLENLIIGDSAPQLSGAMIGKLVASDGAGADFFGWATAISGDGRTCVVGAHADDDRGLNSGSAYIFRTTDGNSWSQIAKLAPGDLSASDFFGYSVAISHDGTRCVVGAYNDGTRSAGDGSAYIFQNSIGNTWVQMAKITAIDGAGQDNLGLSVAMSGDGMVCLLGTPQDDDKGAQSGSVYIVRNTTSNSWSHVAKLLASDGTSGDSLGRAVAISNDGTRVIVGASQDNPKGTSSGSAYIFNNIGGDNWSQVAKLIASDGAANDRFGEAVSISGDGKTCLVGAYGDSDNGAASGSAYVFVNTTNNTWAQEHKFVPGDGIAGAYFGQGVALSGDGNICVIGAARDDDKGHHSGAGYLYKRLGSSWSLHTKTIEDGGLPYNNFGISTSISNDGTVCVIGAGGQGYDGSYKGAVYVFK